MSIKNEQVSDFILSGFSDVERPKKAEMISVLYKQEYPHEQYDLVNALFADNSLKNVEKFYLDIAPTYLSALAMQFYMPKMLSELILGNRNVLDYASFVIANSYDPQSKSDDDRKRLFKLRENMSLKQRQLISLGLTTAALIEFSEKTGNDQIYMRIAEFMLI